MGWRLPAWCLAAGLLGACGRPSSGPVRGDGGLAATPDAPSPSSPPTPALPLFTVDASAPGWSAAELEAVLAGPLEASLAGLPGVGRTEVRCIDGRLRLAALGHPSPDLLAAARAALAAAPLPVLPEPPVLRPAEPEADLRLHYLLRNPSARPGDLARLHRALVRPRLEAVPGVADVRSCGESGPRLLIRPDPALMRALRLGLDDLVVALRGVGSGTTPWPGSPAELARLRLRDDLNLGDLAELELGVGDPGCPVAAGAAGRAVAGRVRLRRTAEPALREALDALVPGLPPGTELRWLEPVGHPGALELRSDLMPGTTPAEAARFAARWAADLLAAGVADDVWVGCASETCGDGGPPRLEAALLPAPGGVGDPRRALAAAPPQRPGQALPTLHPPGPADRLLLLVAADRSALAPAVESLRGRAAALPGVLAVAAEGTATLPDTTVEVSDERAAAAGVDPAALRAALGACGGTPLFEVPQEGEAPLPVVLACGEPPGSADPFDPRRFAVTGTDGRAGPLDAVAEIRSGERPLLRLRVSGRPAARLRLVIDPAAGLADTALTDLCAGLPDGVDGRIEPITDPL